MSGRILVVDDIAANRIVLQARLEAACYEPVLASSGAECLAALEAAGGRRPDLVLVGLDLPDMTGAAMLRRLRGDPRWRDLPVIGLDGGGAADARLSALAAGADDVISKAVPDRVLLARLRNLLRARAEVAGQESLPDPGLAEAGAVFDAAGTIALVPPTGRDGALWAGRLGPHLRDRLIVLSPDQAVDEGEAGGADVFVIDGAGRAGAALLLMSDLKSRQATRHAAVCVTGISLTGDEAAMAYDLGAEDVVGPEVDEIELAARLRCLLRRKQGRDRQRNRLADGLRLSLVDPLTGLYNRRHAGPELRAIAAHARKTSQGYSVMVVDLDRFKSVNDRHGHAAGDAVLVEVAARLRQNLREGDLLARIGGEEFLIALPASSEDEASRVAERLCHAIEERLIVVAPGRGLRVTVSIGVATWTPAAAGGAGVDAIVEAADLALREAKGAGRNQVTIRQTAA